MKNYSESFLEFNKKVYNFVKDTIQLATDWEQAGKNWQEAKELENETLFDDYFKMP